MRDAVPVRIRTGFDHAVVQYPNHYRGSATGPARTSAHAVAAARKVGDSGNRDSLIEQQVATIPGMVIEARNQVTGLEAWGFRSSLRVHSELDYIQH